MGRSTPRAAPPSSTGASACSTPPDLRSTISWREFLKKGYYVVPAEDAARADREPLVLRGPQEGHAGAPSRCRPSSSPASAAACRRRPASSSSSRPRLKRIDDPDRPPLNQYMPLYDDPARPGVRGVPAAAADAALALSVPPDGRRRGQQPARHPRAPRAALGRALLPGRRASAARTRGARHRRRRPDPAVEPPRFRGAAPRRSPIGCGRGSVGADRLGGYRPAGEPGRSTDLGGCVNILNPSKAIAGKSHGIRPNTTLIQVEKWTGVDTWRPAERA